MRSREAVEMALGLHAEPQRSAALRERALPPGIADVLRLAGGNDSLVAEVTRIFGVTPSHAVDAARFFVEQQLLARECAHDPWRVLGACQGAGMDTLREHRRLLVSLVHPDRSDDWAEAYADRVHRAWKVLGQEVSVGSPTHPEDDPSTDRQEGGGQAAALHDGWGVEPPISALRGRLMPSQLDDWQVEQSNASRSGDVLPLSSSPVDLGVPSRLPWRMALPMTAALAVVVVGMWMFDGSSSDQSDAVPALAQPRQQPAENVAPLTALLSGQNMLTGQATDGDQVRVMPGEWSLVASVVGIPTPIDDAFELVETSSVQGSNTHELAAQVVPNATAETDAAAPVADSVVVVVLGTSSTTARRTVSSAHDVESSALLAQSAQKVSADVFVDAEVFNTVDPSTTESPDDALVAITEDFALGARAGMSALAEVPSDADAVIMLDQFIRHYAAGDLQGVLALFSRQRSDGGAAVARDYGELFAVTRDRSLALSEIRLRTDGVRLLGEGRFEARYLTRGRLTRQTVRGRMDFELIRESNNVRFSRLQALSESGAG